MQHFRQTIAAGIVATLMLPLVASAVESIAAPHALPHARVVAVIDPQATSSFKPDEAVVEAMLNRGLTNLSGQVNVSAAWLSFLGTNEVVGIKVYTAPGSDTGTRPQVVAAVVKGLLAAGFATNHIIIWDRRLEDLQRAGFGELATQFGVRIAGAVDVGYDEKTFYDTALMGTLIYGDMEFGRKGDGIGRKSFVSKLVSQQMTKIINVAPLLNHNNAGVAGNLYSLAMGCTDNLGRFENSPERLATAVPELFALPVLSDHVVLNVSDALICQYEGEDRGLLHYSTEQNEIRLSRDPVALDVLALQDLEQLRKARSQVNLPGNWELYKNAALLELGIADPKRIDVITLKPTHGPAETR
ncbi:MAG: hypothetical protein RLY20_3516 [Verrucomicrobiota bacterium]|jgi:hypothetical protein